jgi:hypothetical protein
VSVVDLQEFKHEHSAHLSGECSCMLCRHKWVGVAPVGTTWLQCPNCHSEKGYFLHEVQPPEGFYVFTCDCGSELLHLVKDKNGNCELMCANCGELHRF